MRMADHEANREGVLRSAVNARKITAESIPQYRRMYDNNPQAIHHLLTAPVEAGGLMAGLHGEIGAPAPADVRTEYPAQWVPEVARRAAAPAPVAAQTTTQPAAALPATAAATGGEAYPPGWLPEVVNRRFDDRLVIAGD